MQFGREWTKFAVWFREVSGLESVHLERVDCMHKIQCFMLPSCVDTGIYFYRYCYSTTVPIIKVIFLLTKHKMQLVAEGDVHHETTQSENLGSEGISHFNNAEKICITLLKGVRVQTKGRLNYALCFFLFITLYNDDLHWYTTVVVLILFWATDEREHQHSVTSKGSDIRKYWC